jgi:hypothetical protein
MTEEVFAASSRGGAQRFVGRRARQTPTLRVQNRSTLDNGESIFNMRGGSATCDAARQKISAANIVELTARAGEAV